MSKRIRKWFKHRRSLCRKNADPDDAGKSHQADLPSYPDSEQFERTADPQIQSPLFCRLPPEIRDKIVLEAWLSAGLSQHIYHDGGVLKHSACITDHDGRDNREDVETLLEDIEKGDTTDFVRRHYSEWGNHWACDPRGKHSGKGHTALETGERAASGDEIGVEPQPSLTPFLPILLTSKKMYLEFRPRLYRLVRFTFHHVSTASTLLRNERFANSVTHLQLSLRLPRLFNAISAYDVQQIQPWLGLRAQISELRNLQSLKIWLDTYIADARTDFVRVPELLEFPERLRPVLTLSIPIVPGDEQAAAECAAGGLEFVERRYSDSWRRVYPRGPPREQAGCRGYTERPRLRWLLHL